MKTILMCEPKYFDVTYDINPWMTNQRGKVEKSKSIEQWNKLFESLSKHATVRLVQSIDDLPDMVFTANAGFVHKNTAILSKFSKNERSGEEIHFKNWFEKNGYTVIQPTYSYEGEGDHLVDSLGRHWVGHGFRTDVNVKKELQDYIDGEINMLELADSRWYHLDTAFCPLTNGEIMWYPPAFSKKSQELIENSFNKHILITEQDALKFSCNCVVLGESLFLPINSVATQGLLDCGYKVHEFDLSEFMKAGGAAKCLTLFCSR